MKRFDYFRPRSLEEALELKATTAGSHFMAGGTDLMVQIRRGELEPKALISLRSIPELASIRTNGGITIGASATVTDLIEHSDLSSSFPVFMEAARSLGCPQIRNVATIGGNLCNCSPCADLALPLLILDAQVRIRSISNVIDIPIQNFFLGPGLSCLSADQILTEVKLKKPYPKAKAVFQKKGRVKMDLAVASVAVLLETEGQVCRKIRVSAGSVAPVPIRLEKVEAFLEGKELSPEILDRTQLLAAESVSPISDIRATEEYRRQIVGVYVRRAIARILEEGQS